MLEQNLEQEKMLEVILDVKPKITLLIEVVKNLRYSIGISFFLYINSYNDKIII